MSTTDTVIVHVALEYLEILRVTHEVSVYLQHQTRYQSGTLSKNMGHIQPKHQIVSHLDDDGLACERRSEFVAQVEVVDVEGQSIETAR